MPNIDRMVATSKNRKKNIGQVKIFLDSCKIWDTIVHYNLFPRSTGVSKITKRIVREAIEKIFVTEKGETKLTFSSTKKHTVWQHQK